MSRPRARFGWALATLVLGCATSALAHPASTFGVRLNVSGGTVTAILNADPAPLIVKLDALSANSNVSDEALERIRQHAELIRSLSFVMADTTRVDLTTGTVRTNADGQVEITLTGALPATAREISWHSRLIYGAYPLSVSHGADPVESVFWLQGAEASPMLLTHGPRGSITTFADYTELGFVHILPRGLDHILFVLGLFLLTPRLRSLLAQVSVFTLAHSVSLGLAVYGLVSVPASIVEPLIALSIAYVGVENLFQRTLSSRRLWLVAACGLLHGLGFAGVLSEISLPASQWMPALFGFNVGVELGQLVVLALAASVAYAAARSGADHEQWLRRPASAAIALMGVFWVVTRM